MKTTILAAAALSLALTGCGSSDPCAQADNPAECRAWGDSGGDIQDYLVGGMAGYMIGSVMSGGSRHSVIQRDPNYRGSYRALRRPIASPQMQVRMLERKVAAQKVELRKQQAANARKKAEIRSLRSSKRSSWRSSTRSSFRSSSRGRR